MMIMQYEEIKIDEELKEKLKDRNFVLKIVK